MTGMRPDYRILPPAGWHFLTPIYDLLCSVSGFGTSCKRWVIGLADVAPNHRVLDLGCGTGTLVELLLGEYPSVQVHGVDPDHGALRIARLKAARHQNARVSFHQARAEELPFPEATFDRVICSLAFHHIPDQHKSAALHEVHRTLRADGIFLLADFETTRGVFFWGRRSRQSLEDWLSEAGFHTTYCGHRRGVHVLEARSAETRMPG